jgi:uncharacterized protein (TIGR03437 family)
MKCHYLFFLAAALSTAALADQSGNVTLTANNYLDLDTGAISNAAGDVFWSGTALAAQGQAGLYNLGRSGSRIFKSITARTAARAPYRTASIPASALIVGDIFGVRTNSGHYAKVSVTGVNGASVSLQYTTFIAGSIATHPSALGPPPFIFQVQNNYSFLLPGVPNYGIAPGSLFAIQGMNLSGNQTPVLQSSAPPGLPTTLNQTSLSVTVNGVTTTPALYYASSAAVAAVLPSTTPVGTGTITLNYNGLNSQQAPIQVVASAVGLDTLSGAGSGAGVLTDSSYNLLGLANSAMPGQAVTLWGSGVGADTSNADTTYPQNQNDLTNIPMQVYIGGISANILYRGRSQYPGLDLIDVVIPTNVSLGCYVSVVVETGSVVSNTVTVPVSPKGGPCSDPSLGLSGSQLQTLAAKGAAGVKSLAVTVSQYTNSGGKVTDQATVLASSIIGSEFASGSNYASLGSCAVFPQGGEFPFQAPLDAGTVQVNGVLNLGSGDDGYYFGQLPSGPLTGTYTFSGSGGKDVGTFTVAINIQSPFSLSNSSSLASITRSQGATVTWTGGFAGGDVMLNGVVADPNGGSINFYCHAPSSAGQLTIPSATLLALPPGTGKLVILNATAPQMVSATGLDLGLATGVVSFEVPTTFK